MSLSFFSKNRWFGSKLKQLASLMIITFEAGGLLCFNASSPALPQLNFNTVAVLVESRESSVVLNPQTEKDVEISKIQNTPSAPQYLEEKTAVSSLVSVTQEVYQPSFPVVKHPISRADSGQKKAALTFDDGYDRTSIASVLETLRNNRVQSTFFVVGEVLKSNADLWKQAVSEGHQVCNHTGSHRFFKDLTEEEMTGEVERWERAASEVLGEDYLKRMKGEFPFFRLPGGVGGSDERVINIITRKGYIPIGWSVETVYGVLRHYNVRSTPPELLAERIAAYVPENTQEGGIILLHFVPYDTMQLNNIIKGIQNKGLELKTVSELIGEYSK